MNLSPFFFFQHCLRKQICISNSTQIFKADQLQKLLEYDILKKKNILHFSIKSELGTKRCSSCSRVVFMKICYFYVLKFDNFWGFNAFSNMGNLKGKFSDNLGQNIWRLFAFQHILFKKSETELGYYHQKQRLRKWMQKVPHELPNDLRLRNWGN